MKWGIAALASMAFLVGACAREESTPITNGQGEIAGEVENRVRAHIFLCMLSYYVLWHMMEAWRPLLFADEDQQAKAKRDPVAPAKRSEAAMRKIQTKKLDDGSPASSFRTLLRLLSNIVRNKCRTPGAASSDMTFDVTTSPDSKQRRAYELLKGITV